jgi:hypothetical protein
MRRTNNRCDRIIALIDERLADYERNTRLVGHNARRDLKRGAP